jgi:hypothetical protein
LIRSVIQMPTTLPVDVRAAIDAMAAAERRRVGPMVRILVEDALEARDAMGPVERESPKLELPPIEESGYRRRTMTRLSPEVRARLEILANVEGRTLDRMIAILCTEQVAARRRRRARKSA